MALRIMRILGKDCGCDARKEIVLKHIGGPEATLLAVLALGLIITYRLRAT